MFSVRLLFVLVLVASCAHAFQKCYTRKLTTCLSNADKGRVALYRLRARQDTFIDIRLGPVDVKRAHHWQIVLAKDRMARCAPPDGYVGAQETHCAVRSEYVQPPMFVAARGHTYFKVRQCPVQKCEPTSPCGSMVAGATNVDCQEELILLASNCSDVEIAEVYPSSAVPPVKFCPLGDGLWDDAGRADL
eukprot:TRINITY_DN5769_c0_g1_i1.p2 TRINITY_DN5769_c0_g1~~TRINITY_DN5769_c0_g1_i1.p2  ORF type:complete len:190 (+),score=71.33 TRINITY_DN5769_c0_g1_i1:59-628(+)